MINDTNLLGRRAKALPDKALCDKYYGLKGTIVEYRVELKRIRNGQGNVIATKDTEELWRVEFDQDDKFFRRKERDNVCYTLWLYRTMFTLED